MLEHPFSRYLIRLVDDDEELLDAVGFLLQTEGFRTAVYTNATDFLAEFDPSVPGCILLDVRMPGVSGTQLQDDLNARGTAVPIVFLTGHGDVDLAVHVFRKGACDFLQKPVSPEALTEALQRALALDDETRRRQRQNSPVTAYNSLTRREKEIVADVARYLSNKEIAEHYGLSERTVETHRANAMKKLGFRKPCEAEEFFKNNELDGTF